MPEGQQPVLQDLVTVLRAPNVAISAPDGQLHGEGVQGIYRHDRRLLAGLRITVHEAELLPIGRRLLGADTAAFHGVVRAHSDRAPDPTLRYVRRRTVDEHGATETWTLHNDGAGTARATVWAHATADLASLDVVKSGAYHTPLDPDIDPVRAQWTQGGRTVTLSSSVPADTVVGGQWCWPVAVPAGQSWTVRLSLETHERSDAGGFRPLRPADPVALRAPWPSTGGDGERLLERSLQDLDGLLLSDPDRPDAAFLAAGSPWFFTLFGRDSLWAARLLLPLGTRLAGGTLRALAARQGTRYDPETEEQPGKMPHELRRAALEVSGAGQREPLRLPPLYYGTVDATALWVCLLHDAWLVGLAEATVRELLPNLRAALEWMCGPGDPDGDGFCEYRASPGSGLVNQGWKDSGDGVRWSDGSLAEHPLALCEVQGYAHAAALGGARLLDAFGEDGTPWREWADRLRMRFRESFWVTDEHGRYPAIALDGDKRPVTGPASNMAHLLGTGLLDEAEVALVAQQLSGPGLDSGYGLRTLSAYTTGFNPLSYHCGSVWPHDTAIAVLGLAAEGQHDAAGSLAHGLLRAAERFDYRLPELYGGTDYHAGDPVVAYPAACRPQAWSAAGAVAVVGYLRQRPAAG